MKLDTVWSASDLIKTGLAYTVMGVLVVFLILIIIMLCIKAMALLSGNADTQSKNSNQTKNVEKKAPAPVAVPVVKKDNDEEIVAVITAAIAAMLGESASGFRIRSYRKAQGNEWNQAGRREILERKF